MADSLLSWDSDFPALISAPGDTLKERLQAQTIGSRKHFNKLFFQFWGWNPVGKLATTVLHPESDFFKINAYIFFMENEAKENVLSTSTLVSCCLNLLFWFVFILFGQLVASQPLLVDGDIIFQLTGC